jgi:hypothetical protein
MAPGRPLVPLSGQAVQVLVAEGYKAVSHAAVVEEADKERVLVVLLEAESLTDRSRQVRKVGLLLGRERRTRANGPA